MKLFILMFILKQDCVKYMYFKTYVNVKMF